MHALIISCSNYSEGPFEEISGKPYYNKVDETQ